MSLLYFKQQWHRLSERVLLIKSSIQQNILLLPLKESLTHLYKRIVFIGQMLWILRINNRSSKLIIDFNEAFIPYNNAVLGLTQHCYTVFHRADVYCMWISDTGSYEHSGHYLNSCLHSLLSGLWVLACRRRADLSA